MIYPNREANINLEIHVGRLSGSRLIRDYYDGAADLAPFFTGSAWDPQAYRRKAGEVDGRFTAARRRAMADAVRTTSAASAAKLERIVAEGGFFVTTGQQAGLFTGPLYTIHKTISAIRLAAALEPIVGKPVAPLFWVASDDHDWDEVSHASVVDAANRLERIELPNPGDAPPASMRRRRVGIGIGSALDRLSSSVPVTEFATAAFQRVRGAYRAERTMSQAFADVMADLFEPFDLLIVDAGDPALKVMALDVIIPELEQWEEHAALLAGQTERLIDAGYHAQVGIIPDAANIFYEDESGRERLLREDGHWILRRTGRRLPDDELRALLQLDPARFSPNVVLRPVVESSVFPTLAYVAGPAELGYYAQIGCLFRAHGIEIPLVYPRASIALVEPKVRRVLDKFGLEIDDFRRPVHEVAAKALREELPDSVSTPMTELRRMLDEAYGALADGVADVDPTLRGPVLSARNAAYVQLEELEKKVVQHLKKRNAIELEQLTKAAVNLFPGGQPQERVLNVFPYLARYGPELLPALAAAVDVEFAAVAPAWAGVQCG